MALVRRNLLTGGVISIIYICTLLSCISLTLLPPPNPVWALLSGYYRYGSHDGIAKDYHGVFCVPNNNDVAFQC